VRRPKNPAVESDEQTIEFGYSDGTRQKNERPTCIRPHSGGQSKSIPVSSFLSNGGARCHHLA
jgi:hypothetical protein